MNEGGFNKITTLLPSLKRLALLCFILSVFSLSAHAQNSTTTPTTASAADKEVQGNLSTEKLENLDGQELVANNYIFTPLNEGSSTTTSFGIGVGIPPPKTKSPELLKLEIKELGYTELPETAWASTTTSTVWQIDIKGEDGKTWKPAKPIKISMQVTGPYLYKKVIYFWDGNKKAWQPLPSTTDFEQNTVSTPYPLPYGRFIIRDHPKVYEGLASWYRWKTGHYAAFRLLPKKTILKVTNISGSPRHGKQVEIAVNDYGPEEWTGRLIDLEYHAYAHIGIPRGGVMWVRVEPVVSR